MKIKTMNKPFLLALSFLTRFSIPHLDNITTEDSSRSVLFYPVVGLVIGVILLIPVLLFSNTLPLLLSAIIVVIWAMITGGLHLDGLADSADAWLGGIGETPSNNTKTHRILKDPVAGTAGVIAIVSILLLKVVTLSVLLEKLSWTTGLILILAPIIGRGMILLVFLSTDYVRKNGLGNALIENLPKDTALWIIGVCGLVAILLSFWGLAFVLVSFWLLRRLMLERLGGCTGDTIGATVEISEMLWLLGAALSIG